MCAEVSGPPPLDHPGSVPEWYPERIPLFHRLNTVHALRGVHGVVQEVLGHIIQMTCINACHLDNVHQHSSISH